MYAGLCNYTRIHKCRASPLAVRALQVSNCSASCFTAFAMTVWQYKLMSELDRTCASSSVGWGKIGPTASFRLRAILDGNIQLHTGVFLQTSPCVSFKWYPMEILESPLAVLLMRNDQKANGECRYMIAKPIGGVALSLQAMPAEDHMVKIVVMYLSGTVLLELEYAADMPVKEIFDDVKGQLEANGGYTRWDLEAVSIVPAGQPLKAAGSIAKLLPGGTGKGTSKAMGEGKGKKVIKKPSLKRPSAKGS